MAEPERSDPDQTPSSDGSTLAKRWPIISLAFAAGAVAFFAVSALFLPKVYESSGSVFIDRNTQLGSMSGLTSTLGLQSSQSGYVVSLLQSDTMMRRVCNELSLASNPEFAHEGPNRSEKAQTMLKRAITVKIDKNGAVAVAARTKNAKLSADIVNHMLNNLGKLFKTKSEQKAQYLEKQIQQTQEKLKVAEQQLLSFQQSTKIALIDEETKTFIQQIGALESQLISLDVDLQQAKSELADEGDLEELVKLKVKKRSLEASRAVLVGRIEEAKRKLAGAPQASLEYARITRNIAMQSKTIEMLTEQYQLASMTQHGEDGDYQVIDWSQPKYEPVGPRSFLNALLGGAAGALLACLILLSPRRKDGKVTN